MKTPTPPNGGEEKCGECDLNPCLNGTCAVLVRGGADPIIHNGCHGHAKPDAPKAETCERCGKPDCPKWRGYEWHRKEHGDACHGHDGEYRSCGKQTCMKPELCHNACLPAREEGGKRRETVEDVRKELSDALGEKMPMTLTTLLEMFDHATDQAEEIGRRKGIGEAGEKFLLGIDPALEKFLLDNYGAFKMPSGMFPHHVKNGIGNFLSERFAAIIALLSEGGKM